MNRAITPAACLESIELRIDMDNKIIDKIQNLLELSYLLGFLEGIDQRFKEQSQSSEEFSLMVQVPAEVLEEQRRRMGSLKSRTINVEVDVDCEAYIVGIKHAKETKLMPEELLKDQI